MLQYTINNDTLTVFDEDFVPFSIDSSHPNYKHALYHVEKNEGADLTFILDLMKPIESVKKAVSGTGITIERDTLYRNGVELHGLLIDRILFHHSAGNTIDHLVRFLDKLYLNPSHRVVNQLYGFLEASNVAITPDGNFVAYKIVNHQYKDLYTGRFDNSPGVTVKVERNQVDEDPDRTCSNGLHVCGFDYLHAYGAVRSGSDRVMSVSVNPADVVAVPRDYNNNKMRVSSYTVLSDITDKVKATWNAGGGIGTTVGLYHTLSYTNSDWDFTDDDWDDTYGEEEDDYGSKHPDDQKTDDYFDGEWVDHDGSGMPEWVEPTDMIEADGALGRNTKNASWFMWSHVTKYRLKD
jgi:hypothetical protein